MSHREHHSWSLMGYTDVIMFSLLRKVLTIKNSIKPKRSLKPKILLLFRVIICIVVINIYKTTMHHVRLYHMYNYPHLPAEDIETHLYNQITPELVLPKSKPECEYGDILKSTSSPLNWEVPTVSNFTAKGLVNGSYVPEHCNPKFSVALIVVYRNRPIQLDMFLPYIHNFLRKQNIHYRIYLVEQQDEKTFNRGLLFNIGAMAAIRDKFPCLILHDVDLLPLDASNLYACTNEPRHMSASIDKYEFVLPYVNIAGGAFAIKSQQFVAVNGFSNKFYGWGGEDDDFAYRLHAHKFRLVRFSPKTSRYTMMKHGSEPRSSGRSLIIRETRQHGGGVNDGLSTLPHITTHVKNHRLFTVVGVQF